MTLFRDRGLVLRTIRLGEADRIVTLMTHQHGKVRAVAKGVRRTTSKFGSRLEPLSHVALLGWQGRGDLDMINQVEVIDTNRTVREDLDRMTVAMVMLEVVDQVAQERHANPRLYEMLVGAIAALAERNSAMVSPAFFLKVLALEGSAPMLDMCVSCGEDGRRRAGRLRPVGGRRAVPELPTRASVVTAGAVAVAAHTGRRSGRCVGRAPLSGHRRGGRAGHRGDGDPPRPPAPGPAGRAGGMNPTTAVRRLRAHPVLPVPLRLLRLRHLHRPRSPDGAVRGRLRDRDRTGSERRGTAPRHLGLLRRRHPVPAPGRPAGRDPRRRSPGRRAPR